MSRLLPPAASSAATEGVRGQRGQGRPSTPQTGHPRSVAQPQHAAAIKTQGCWESTPVPHLTH